MTVKDGKIHLSEDETVGHLLKVLDSDIEVFLGELTDTGLTNDARDKFLVNMYKSVNFHLSCLNGKQVCFNHDDTKHPNREIVFVNTLEVQKRFLHAAWNTIARELNRHCYDKKLEELNELDS